MAVSSTTGGLRTGVCLSTDRPQNPYNGQVVYETDTNRTLVWDNSAWVVIADASTTGFPTSLDTNSVGAIQALQAKVGVDGSAVTSSLDYKVNELPAGIVGDSSTPTGYTLTGTLADIPGLSFTFNAETGRLYRFLFYCGSTENAAVATFRINMKIVLNGTEIQNGYFGSLPYGYPYLMIGLWTPGTPTAGSVTAKVRGFRDAGASGGYLYADAGTPMRFFCEDIGLA